MGRTTIEVGEFGILIDWVGNPNCPQTIEPSFMTAEYPHVAKGKTGVVDCEGLLIAECETPAMAELVRAALESFAERGTYQAFKVEIEQTD